VKVSTTWYIAPEEIRWDLDVFNAFYNAQRTQEVCPLKVRTSARALRETLDVDRLSASAPPANGPKVEGKTMPAETA
jgi:hypothetical protein